MQFFVSVWRLLTRVWVHFQCRRCRPFVAVLLWLQRVLFRLQLWQQALPHGSNTCWQYGDLSSIAVPASCVWLQSRTHLSAFGFKAELTLAPLASKPSVLSLAPLASKPSVLNSWTLGAPRQLLTPQALKPTVLTLAPHAKWKEIARNLRSQMFKMF